MDFQFNPSCLSMYYFLNEYLIFSIDSAVRAA